MRFETKEDQFNALCQPFPVDLIKQREQGGALLSYYPVEVIRPRLNEVFEGAYEFRVQQVITTEKTMDMSCVLTLRWVDGTTTTVEEWGSSDILYSHDGKRRVNEPTKTCASDSLKRCLAFIGCGAELYSESYRESVAVQKNQQQAHAREKALFTCQECQGVITDAVVGGKMRTAKDILDASRKRFRKRLCVACATKEAAVHKAVV